MPERRKAATRASRYRVGIDLGTSNSALAYCKPGGTKIEVFQIPQLIAPGSVSGKALLPSVCYRAGDGEVSSAQMQLPWPSENTNDAGNAQNSKTVTGQFARLLGAQAPGRFVSSAKSWLSHREVDRNAAILPWTALPDVAKISPVDASAMYLQHLRRAWDHAHPSHPLAAQEIVLTVPASFDEAARALTLEAAKRAGLPELLLLEEPQAAFYDWLYRHKKQLHTALAATRMVLVCDIGGGTTDFSLIACEIVDGEAVLTRVGVGNHLMLGGDNMDLALAHLAEQRLGQAQPGQKLPAQKFAHLIDRCRLLKEQLLAQDAPQQALVTLLGEGSKLIQGGKSVEFTREEVERLIIDGFLPQISFEEKVRQARSGLVEFGLPYCFDPAITRHLADFLRRHADLMQTESGAMQMPDTMLLNGGVFHAPAIAKRLQQVLSDWRGQALTLLHNDSPDLAVARGAVAYALARQNKAPKIGGGSARSYFLLLQQAQGGQAARAICILPRGSEAGQELALEHPFALKTGQPVRFHLVAVSAQAGQATPRLGEIITLEPEQFEALPPLTTVLNAASGDNAAPAKQEIPVTVHSMLTEVGVLEIHCCAMNDAPAKKRWRLDFQLRASDEPSNDGEAYRPPPGIAAALEKIERIFGKGGGAANAKEVKQLRAQLEQILGPRERWSTPLLRQLYDALAARSRARRRSPQHEQSWFNLAGYCLRPGFGDPLDSWRIEQLWPLYQQGAQYKNDAQVCSEWWTFWRRVCGGLDANAQLQLLDEFALNLQGSAEDLKHRPAHSVPGSRDDMLRLGAALERIPANYKAEIGNWLMQQIGQKADQQVLAALARVGSRVPFYGSAHDVVDAETAAAWLQQLFAYDWRENDAFAFACTHIARLCGDRLRDIAPLLREQIDARLQQCGAPHSWRAMLTEVVQLDETQQRRILGDALPPGLKLLHKAPA